MCHHLGGSLQCLLSFLQVHRERRKNRSHHQLLLDINKSISDWSLQTLVWNWQADPIVSVTRGRSTIVALDSKRHREAEIAEVSSCSRQD